MVLTPAQIKPKSFESTRNSFFFLLFFYPGLCVSCLRACLGARLLPQCYGQYPNLSEGADRVGGQLRGDKECPFSGVTKSGRVWRKVPESGARSDGPPLRHRTAAARSTTREKFKLHTCLTKLSLRLTSKPAQRHPQTHSDSAAGNLRVPLFEKSPGLWNTGGWGLTPVESDQLDKHI